MQDDVQAITAIVDEVVAELDAERKTGFCDERGILFRWAMRLLDVKAIAPERLN